MGTEAFADEAINRKWDEETAFRVCGTGLRTDGRRTGLMVNFDCRHALVAHAEHFVAVYEADPSAANRADARYFVAMLKDSDCKERLLKRIK